MSSNFVEMIKKLISVFGRKPARGLPKPPPSAPRLDSATFTRGENAKLTRGAPNLPAVLRPGEKGRGGKILRFYNNLITKQYFNALLFAKMCIPFLLLIALTNCAHLLSACLTSINGVLYSEGRVCKTAPEQVASPQSTALHSTGNTSVKNSVTRTKSATTAHVE
jgi:hypothetical protein